MMLSIHDAKLMIKLTIHMLSIDKLNLAKKEELALIVEISSRAEGASR